MIAGMSDKSSLSECLDLKEIEMKISLAVVSNFEKPWRFSIDSFSQIEKCAVAKTRSDPVRRNIRRWVCEAMLRDISIKISAPDSASFEAVWKRMLSLGFSSDETRMSMRFYHLTYLIENLGDGKKIDREMALFEKGVKRLLALDDKRQGEHYQDVLGRLKKQYAESSVRR